MDTIVASSSVSCSRASGPAVRRVALTAAHTGGAPSSRRAHLCTRHTGAHPHPPVRTMQCTRLHTQGPHPHPGKRHGKRRVPVNLVVVLHARDDKAPGKHKAGAQASAVGAGAVIAGAGRAQARHRQVRVSHTVARAAAQACVEFLQSPLARLPR